MANLYRFHWARLGAGLLALGMLCGAPLRAQRGAYVQPRNLAELVSQSAVIVRGTVMSARVEPHPELTHLSTVVVILRVAETLKGAASGTFTFRQFIWDIRDRYDAAGYRKGQHLLLLLNPTTSYGLRSPAGLEQGRFRISRDAEGQEVAVNGHGNVGLWERMDTELKSKRLTLSPRSTALLRQHPTGPIALNDLRDFTRDLAALTPR
ncbi:MAG: hypothetical protein ABSG54_09625 [Terriglobia bacterium]